MSARILTAIMTALLVVHSYSVYHADEKWETVFAC
jgi:hypothetical protein